MDIALALGGGGSKGNAHIGVLKVFEREGFNIKALAGTSMGGLIGAVYAVGYSPNEILDKFRRVDQNKLYGRSPGSQPALLGLAGATQVLADVLGDINFNDLQMPFAVTAVDLNTGQSIVIKEGRVLDAVLSTIALPGIFPARELDEFLLVDGGLIDPVPVSVARSLSPRLPVVAVALSRITDPHASFPVPGIASSSPVIEYLSRWRVAQALNVFVRSMEVSGRLLTELRLEVDKPDLIIRPDVAGVGLLDEVDVEEIVQLGAAAAEEALPEMRKLFNWRSRLARLVKRK